jgi:ectoine hydroxylase-related dioxygenase (phytanoyl-CoA dioxygenase family)
MAGRSSGRLDDAEKAALETNGYVLRTGVFDAAELADITAACEALVTDLVRDRRGKRYKVGSYVFEPELTKGVFIKWEGDSDIVHGIEPCAHLSPPLHAWALDPRFVEPMKDVIGHEEPILFTEKLNLKRPHHGGENPLHQDYPYWIDSAEVASEVATAMLFLDDATLANGCLRVVPGSHKDGQWQTRKDGDRFGQNEVDVNAYAGVTSVPLEVKAGSVVMFGPFLVHQSAPNRSAAERRALLYSYQPAGRRHSLESLRKMGERRRSNESA